MRYVTTTRETLKKIIEIILVKSNKDLKSTYKAISKTFSCTIHEETGVCLKFENVSNILTWTKHIAVHCHFFCTKVQELEIKIIGINANNQLKIWLKISLLSKEFH